MWLLFIIFGAIAGLFGIFFFFHFLDDGGFAGIVAGDNSPLCSAIVSICGFALSLLLFFIAFSTMPHCSACDTVSFSSYCKQCGEPVNIPIVCPDCGKRCDSPFCGHCGAAINKEG